MDDLLTVLRNICRGNLFLSLGRSTIAVRLKELFLSHDAKYHSDYYARTVEPSAVRSAKTMSESILSDLQPKTVVDVGCGTGALLEPLQERGCEVLGLEYSKAAIHYCRSRGIRVREFNLERDDLGGNERFDVAISMEVAEHLPKRTAGRYVEILTRLSNIIVFTAAPPGQGGCGHVNEQPSSYWIAKFQALDFAIDEELTKRWRESWRDSALVECWYYQNLIVFRRRASRFVSRSLGPRISVASADGRADATHR